MLNLHNGSKRALNIVVIDKIRRIEHQELPLSGKVLGKLVHVHACLIRLKKALLAPAQLNVNVNRSGIAHQTFYVCICRKAVTNWQFSESWGRYKINLRLN